MNKILIFFNQTISKRLEISLLAMILFFGRFTFSQENLDFPEYFYNQFNTYLTTNSAAIIDTSKIEIGSFYNSYSGGFSKIRNFDVYGIYRPSKRIEWLSEINSNQEGPVFQKNRVLIGHMQQMNLSPNITLKVGGKIGLANYSFRPSSSGTGGSAFAFDGSVGISLFSDQWLIGTSLQQFPSSKIQPINQIFVLQRYWEFQGNYLFNLGKVDLKAGLRSRLTNNINLYQISTQFKYYSLLVGGDYSNIGCSFSLGYYGSISNMKQKSVLLSILYHLPNNNNLQSINQSQFEIIVKFFVL